MTIESDRDLAGLRRAGRVVALALREMKRSLEPGMTTAELDAVDSLFRGNVTVRDTASDGAQRYLVRTLLPGACSLFHRVRDDAGVIEGQFDGAGI
jgi:hypothetical protein